MGDHPRSRGEHFTLDTHFFDYLDTQEGKYLPITHCVNGTKGHHLPDGLDARNCMIVKKSTFGSLNLANHLASRSYTEIELCGVCTDICVISNALILKAALPEVEISVDASCCAGTTPEAHEAALLVMHSCQVVIV